MRPRLLEWLLFILVSFEVFTVGVCRLLQRNVLATHIRDELIQHGHGAPLRLVAPGRRGFQWVKWVTEIEVLTATDYGQWLVIFTSGLQQDAV